MKDSSKRPTARVRSSSRSRWSWSETASRPLCVKIQFCRWTLRRRLGRLGRRLARLGRAPLLLVAVLRLVVVAAAALPRGLVLCAPRRNIARVLGLFVRLLLRILRTRLRRQVLRLRRQVDHVRTLAPRRTRDSSGLDDHAPNFSCTTASFLAGPFSGPSLFSLRTNPIIIVTRERTAASVAALPSSSNSQSRREQSFCFCSICFS